MTTAARSPTPRPQGVLDVERAAAALLGTWVVWAGVASAAAGRILSPLSPYVGAPIALAVGVSLGGFAQRVPSRMMEKSLVGTAVFLFLSALFTLGPALSPTGYANANAALAVQLIGAAGLGMARADREGRNLLWLTIGNALAVIVVNRSAAALAIGVMVAAAALVSRLAPKRRWPPVVIGSAAFVAAMGAVTWLARRQTWPPALLRDLDSARQSLWLDAYTQWSAHRLVGIGPGRFEEVSRLGHDADTAAAHSAVLQIAAETGVVGVLLFTLIGVFGFAWAARRSAVGALVGCASWAAVLVHAQMDHLLDFPIVVLAAGFVLGWAGVHDQSEQLDVPEAERPLLPPGG